MPVLVPVLAIALVASGCASSSSTKTAAPVAVQTHSTPRAVAAVPIRLSILSPRNGAHTSSTLTVRVALHGSPGGGARFSYVLDGHLTRLGSGRLTYHDLAPGRHRLDVSLASRAASRAVVAFTVRAPAPVAVPAPAQTVSTATESTPPPPPAATTTPPPSSPPRTTPAPQPSEGIPQGGGGDGDGDNSGGPSDGDGNM